MRDHEAIINKIFKLLCNYKPQPEALREHLKRVLTGRLVSGREVICERDGVMKDVLFVSDGYVACYGFNRDGDRQVLRIIGKNAIVSGKSFTAQCPSAFEWVCLPGTYLMAISYDLLREIYVLFPGTAELAKIVMADSAENDLLDRLLLYKDAEVVVEDFYRRFKEFKIPGRMLLDIEIASYLLIAESTLRNVRSKLIREGRW